MHYTTTINHIKRELMWLDIIQYAVYATILWLSKDTFYSDIWFDYLCKYLSIDECTMHSILYLLEKKNFIEIKTREPNIIAKRYTYYQIEKMMKKQKEEKKKQTTSIEWGIM